MTSSSARTGNRRPSWASTRRARRTSTACRRRTAPRRCAAGSTCGRCARLPTSGGASRGGTLQTQDMIGKLRAAHARRYELPLISGPVAVPRARRCRWTRTPSACCSATVASPGATTPSFSTEDPELAEALEEALPGVEVAVQGRLSTTCSTGFAAPGEVITLENPVTGVMREPRAHAARDRTRSSCPREYLLNTRRSAARACCRACSTRDGGPVTQADRTCRVQYTTTSPQLRDDVVELVRSLGGCRVRAHPTCRGRAPGRANGRDVPLPP